MTLKEMMRQKQIALYRGDWDQLETKEYELPWHGEEKTKKDAIHKKQAARIVELYEKGINPFNSLWHISGNQQHGAFGEEYNGSNWIFLQMECAANDAYKSRWYTFDDAFQEHFKIKKGEKGTPVEYYRVYDSETSQSVDEQWYDSLPEVEQYECWKNGRLHLQYKVIHVFNEQQLERSEKEANVVSFEINLKKISADEIAYHSKLSDDVAAFTKDIGMIGYDIESDQYEYYITHLAKADDPEGIIFEQSMTFQRLHAFLHATGHPSRLNRSIDPADLKSRAREELRVWMATLLLSRYVDIKRDFITDGNHAIYAYLWYEMIKNDPNVLHECIRDAEDIYRYIAMDLKQSRDIDLPDPVLGPEEDIEHDLEITQCMT